jgi:hypothetical protein
MLLEFGWAHSRQPTWVRIAHFGDGLKVRAVFRLWWITPCRRNRATCQATNSDFTVALNRELRSMSTELDIPEFVGRYRRCQRVAAAW